MRKKLQVIVEQGSSISQTFYVQIFRTNVVSAALRFDFGKKFVRKTHTYNIDEIDGRGQFHQRLQVAFVLKNP